MSLLGMYGMAYAINPDIMDFLDDMMHGRTKKVSVETASYCPKCSTIWYRNKEMCVYYSRICETCDIPMTELGEWYVTMDFGPLMGLMFNEDELKENSDDASYK